MPEEQVQAILDSLPDMVVESLLGFYAADGTDDEAMPGSPLEQALELDSGFRVRPHLQYLSDKITEAVEKVEQGESQFLIVSMPPRLGKSMTCSFYTPLWTLRKHPEWKHVLVSHDDGLATGFGRQIRRAVEDHPELGLRIARDAGAVASWETTEKGSVLARTWRGSLTGRGAKVLIIDDPFKDFADAHSSTIRNTIWNWWLTVALTRLEAPVLVMVIMTRWHEDDLVGRLLSTEYDGEPSQWQVINFPAIAEHMDVLGRNPGQPLYSPLLEESESEAITRWASVKKSVGTYTWSGLYQQHPSPAEGAIFSMDSFRYWTRNKSLIGPEHPNLVYFEPEQHQVGRWVDSWDMAFKATDTSDYVVGQRWVKVGANRFLVLQSRGRRTFTETVKEVKRWADPDKTLCASFVHKRLVEDKANGPAIINRLRNKVSGIKPINPKDSKEARARAVTPEVESHNVILPYPGDPGNEWVRDLLEELRSFPSGSHDDQVDAMTQALDDLRDVGKASVSKTAQTQRTVQRTYAGRSLRKIPGR